MYCKIFKSLYQGTLRGKPHEILVFTNLLAECDQDGVVDKHYKAIADEVGLTIEQVKVAIANLESPDPESRSPEMQGARIVRVDEHRAWGWRVVNYLKYRAIKSYEDRREQNRLAQERYRKRKADESADVSKSKQSKPIEKQIEIEIEKEKDQTPSNQQTKTNDSNRDHLLTLDVGEGVVEDFAERIYQAYPRKEAKVHALRAIRLALRKKDGNDLLNLTIAYANSVEGKEKRFIPHPATWFNGERWEDKSLPTNTPFLEIPEVKNTAPSFLDRIDEAIKEGAFS